jgi:hypothetical protein
MELYGRPSTFAAREFANEINIAVKETDGADAQVETCRLSGFICSPLLTIAAN